MKKIKTFLEAVVVITVVLALVLPSSAIITNTTIKNNTKLPYKLNTVIESAIKKEQSSQNTLSRGEDYLISWDNPDEDDNHPKITMNNDEVIVVTYEKTVDILSKVIPLSYSDDNGATWTTQFEFNSIEWEEGSGILESPDVTFSEVADNFFWMSIDPLATNWNDGMTWIPSDIAGATEVLIWRYSWLDSVDYTEGATTYVGEWQLLLDINTHTTQNIVQTPCLGYWWFNEDDQYYYHPGEVNPEWAAGGYVDGQSVLKTAPASKPEMATGANRIFMVMETYDEDAGYSKISYKATYTDLDPESETFLFTLGGGPSDMDKYADIEVWPWQMFIAEDAEDPDVAAQGSIVAVVYSQNGDVKCKASDDDGDNWAESTVATGAGYPCVYVSGDKIYVAYVQNGNLYLVNSDNLGGIWSTPVLINDNPNTVVAEPGTASLGGLGIVWTDSQNGADDIYFEYIDLTVNQPPGAPTITGPDSGKGGEELSFTFNAVDPDGNQVKYIIDWDDTTSNTTDLYPSGTDVTVNHIWTKGGQTYVITAKAQDSNGAIGPETTKEITIQKSKALNLPWFKFLQKYPNLFLILKYLLGL